MAVEAYHRLSPLPAAIEVAAYRIVLEALTNVVQHAGASSAVVQLALRGQDLVLAVRDDGGSVALWTPGVGIASTRERAAQVGGTLRITDAPSGWLVEATIPVGPTD